MMGSGNCKTLLVLSLILSTLPNVAGAQSTFYERVRAQNSAMAGVQPGWMGPLIQSDVRLSQAVRLSVSAAHAPGEQIFSYGNNHGISFLAGRRFQLDLNPPSWFRNHSAAWPDGFGNASTQMKYRIASGNSQHGDFAVTAMLSRAFGGGFAQNAMLTGFYCPKLGAGKAFGRFNVQSVVNGVLPTGKVAQQGRVLEWNTTAQVHATAHSWFDIENNTAHFFAGPDDGMTQNFMTPAAFYTFRRRTWEPTHTAFVVNAGMQIATSRFHCYDHNLITELRILF